MNSFKMCGINTVFQRIGDDVMFKENRNLDNNSHNDKRNSSDEDFWGFYDQ
jgi:hypothetical protein